VYSPFYVSLALSYHACCALHESVDNVFLHDNLSACFPDCLDLIRTSGVGDVWENSARRGVSVFLHLGSPETKREESGHAAMNERRTTYKLLFDELCACMKAFATVVVGETFTEILVDNLLRKEVRFVQEQNNVGLVKPPAVFVNGMCN
jgi:hypothetical protein